MQLRELIDNNSEYGNSVLKSKIIKYNDKSRNTSYGILKVTNNNVARNICKCFNNFKLNEYLLKVDYCQEDVQ